jgi:SAM-dependent methyltransferase
VAYTFSGYESPLRWASYFTQIRCALDGPEGPALLVGVGSGTTLRELRARGRQVTALDIDPDLGPDVVGSVTELPFDDGAFAVSVCCEVLEHLPWSEFPRAAGELRRVTRGRLVFSVPDVRYYAGLTAFAGIKVVRKTLRIDVPRLVGRQLPPGSNHHWEIGRGRTARQVRDALAGCGWTVEQEFRDERNPYHRFYIAR